MLSYIRIAIVVMFGLVATIFFLNCTACIIKWLAEPPRSAIRLSGIVAPPAITFTYDKDGAVHTAIVAPNQKDALVFFVVMYALSTVVLVVCTYVTIGAARRRRKQRKANTH